VDLETATTLEWAFYELGSNKKIPRSPEAVSKTIVRMKRLLPQAPQDPYVRCALEMLQSNLPLLERHPLYNPLVAEIRKTL
jgi:hypothetical protein